MQIPDLFQKAKVIKVKLKDPVNLYEGHGEAITQN